MPKGYAVGTRSGRAMFGTPGVLQNDAANARMSFQGMQCCAFVSSVLSFSEGVEQPQSTLQFSLTVGV